MKLSFELDPDVNALYIRFRHGKFARTIYTEGDVLIDVDEHGRPLGMEFVNADDFLPFLRRHSGHVAIPDQLDDSLEGMFPAAD